MKSHPQNFSIFISIIVMVSLASCNTSPTVDVAAATASLRKADSAYSAAGMSKNLDAFMSLYSSDCAVIPPGGPVVLGVDSVRKMMASFMNDPTFTAVFSNKEIEVSKSGDMGYTYALVELNMTVDGKTMTEKARDFHLWRKQTDGNWKLVKDIWNSGAPEPQPAP